MIDVVHDELISPREVADTYPSRVPGKKLHKATVHAWMTIGRKGIRLESVVLGGGRFTTRTAVAQFSEALSRRRGGTSAPEVATSARTEKAQRRNHEAVERELDRIL